MRRAAPALFLLLAAAGTGCLEGAADAPAEATPAPGVPATQSWQAALCRNVVLFQLVDYGRTDAFLPPGYRPRDPQDFFGSPVAVGQAAVVAILLDCPAWNGTEAPWRSGLLAVYVQPPQVPGAPTTPARDFYEVERYGEDLDGLLGRVGWPLYPSRVTFAEGGLGTGLAETANVSDDAGDVLTVGVLPQAPMDLAGGPARFWRDLAAGTGYLEFEFPAQAEQGPALCILRDGSTAQALAGETSCPPGEPLGAVFPGLGFALRFGFLGGVHAR